MDPIIIKDVETLCQQLLYEIACDILETNKNYDNIFLVSPIEKNAVKVAFQPHLTKLPEYNYLVETLFSRSSSGKS